MKSALFFNALNFNYPVKPLTFYFSLVDKGDSYKVHKSKFPLEIDSLFPILKTETPKFIYTTYEVKSEGFLPLTFTVSKHFNRLYKQYLNHKIESYFKKKGYVTKINFVQNPQVWVLGKNNDILPYKVYYKFSLKIQFEKLSHHPELIISYDGATKVLKTPISKIANTDLIKKAITNQQWFKYNMVLDSDSKNEFWNSLNFEESYPILNRNLAADLNIELKPLTQENKYKTYLKYIKHFAENLLDNSEFKAVLNLQSTRFINVPQHRIDYVDKDMNLLQYRNSTGRKPQIELQKYKCFLRPKHYQIFYVFHETQKEFVSKLAKQLKNGTGKYYNGLAAFLDVPYHSDSKNAICYTEKDNPLPEIKERLKEIVLDENYTYAAIYISPYSKFEEKKNKRDVYYKVKELFLNYNIISQAIDYEKMAPEIDKYSQQFTLSNISLALIAKLQGVPWKLKTPDKKELIIGVGAFKNKDENINYIASAFSFQNNGIFNEFDYFSETETSLLSGSICNAIRKFYSIAHSDKVVIHFYKEMSQKELAPIIRGMSTLNLEVPLYILHINKTDSEDIIAFDSNWHGKLMPKSGIFIRIGFNQYLLFNNSRHTDDVKYNNREGFPFPIKLSISSPTENALEDNNVIKGLIEQVYQFSRLYWKSLRQQNVPITIKYPEMVAKIAPHFDGDIPLNSKDKLWFL